MEYKRGAIVRVEGTVFEDNGVTDLTGHPSMIPVATDPDSNMTYYVIITSQIRKYNIYPDRYFDLRTDWQEAGLRKPSLINLAYIYKARIDTRPFGELNPNLYQSVISKLKTWQDQHPGKLYGELKPLI